MFSAVLMSLLLGCGGDVAEDSAGCAPIEGYPTAPLGEGVCADYGADPQVFGCTVDGCTGELKFASDPSDPGVLWSFGGCVPEGWVRSDAEWQECP